MGDSKGNGMVERGKRDVEAQIRTMAAALEEKTGQKLDPGSSVLSWLVLHAGTLLQQLSVGKDGKTPHQRLRGRKSKKQLMEFGKSVHFMPLDALDQPNADPRCMDDMDGYGWVSDWALRSTRLGMRLQFSKPDLFVEHR